MWMLLCEATRSVSLVVDKVTVPLNRGARWVFAFEPTPGRVHDLIVIGLVRVGVDGRTL